MVAQNVGGSFPSEPTSQGGEQIWESVQVLVNLKSLKILSLAQFWKMLLNQEKIILFPF